MGSRPSSSYSPQLEGLRAVAVVLVLFHHFDGPIYKDFNFGPIGVRFFFVASGFLITRILLKARVRFELGRSTWQAELGNFQLRRLIRTVPVYYLSLFLAAIIGIPPVRQSLAWTMSFLTNFYMEKVGYYPDTISHFWSLAVQEQFYLFWPLLIFFLPMRWMKYSFGVMVAASLIFRLYCIHSGASEIVRWFSLPGSLDSFAVGGCAAYAAVKNPELIIQHTTRFWSGGLAALAMLAANALRRLPMQHPAGIWIELLEGSAMGWLLACSITGFRGWFGQVLASRPLTYLGQISYGIYVYHVLVSILLLPLFIYFGYGDDTTPAVNLRFFIQTSVTVGAASLSWYFFEQPILKVRDNLAGWFTGKPAAASR